MQIFRKTLLPVLFTLFALQGFSQEQLGLRLSNYSGIHGTLFNPAFNVNSPLRWDINVIAAGAFAENNYAYIRDASLIKVLRNKTGFTYAGDLNAEPGAQQTNRLVYDFTRGERRKEAFTSTFVTGPSAMFHVKKHTFGVFFNFRSAVSANRVSPSLGYYDADALQAGDVLHIEPFKAAGMTWSEVGFNYGRKIFSKGKHTLNGGASIKFLQGYEGVYLQNHDPLDITLNIDSMQYADANATFGVATGMGFDGNPYDGKVRGYGASLDLGVVYYKSTESKKRPYDWKAGVSLLDFGKIAFNKDAQDHELNTEVAFDFIQDRYAGAQDFNDLFNELSFQSLNDSSATYVDDRFSIWTPAGITFFVERAITNHFFVNATVVRRLRFKGAVPERDNIWALTPRYEHKWFEVSVPFVLYNDKDIRMGAAVRLGPVVIGSDNLTSWFGSQDFTGSDIYFALKLNPFTLKKDGQVGRKQGRGSHLDDCFEFRQ